jgi:hypothetical protein
MLQFPRFIGNPYSTIKRGYLPQPISTFARSVAWWLHENHPQIGKCHLAPVSLPVTQHYNQIALLTSLDKLELLLLGGNAIDALPSKWHSVRRLEF